MTRAVFDTKSVHDLITHANGQPNQFWIPAYQRGYRWKPMQVTQLLEDVREFAKRENAQPHEYYCLQPLVLKDTRQGQYEVVDGQQRLTTLLLILRHFNERMAVKYRSKLFSLAYETRPELRDFLDDPSEDIATRNVDYFYLYQAIQTIEQWFESRDHEFEEIKSTLLNKTRVIWYELSDRENAVDAFTRLNVGKIALTNDELIRALFLRQRDDAEGAVSLQQLQIAHEWDQLEKALQNDAFWYFLNNKTSGGHNRIGFLFTLIARLDAEPSFDPDERYSVFHTYNRRLSAAGATTASEWLRVKQVYMLLEEWFEDRRLYHIIGFLVHSGTTVDAIFRLSQGIPKRQFEQKLRSLAFLKLTGTAMPETATADILRATIKQFLGDLEYGQKHALKIRTTLLLFNLTSLLQNLASNIRFQFDSFKANSWDIEHVRSVTTSIPKGKTERDRWLQLARKQLTGADDQRELCQAIAAYFAQTESATDTQFHDLHTRVLAAFKEDSEVDDSIGNLTLLDAQTNRGYGNAVFAVKRERILELDQRGIFVPLCTRNLFLKCYSQGVDHLLFWSVKDSQGYLEAMCNTLVNFFLDKQEPSV